LKNVDQLVVIDIIVDYIVLRFFGGEWNYEYCVILDQQMFVNMDKLQETHGGLECKTDVLL